MGGGGGGECEQSHSMIASSSHHLIQVCLLCAKLHPLMKWVESGMQD